MAENEADVPTEITEQPSSDKKMFVDPVTKKPIEITKDIEILLGHIGSTVRNAENEKKRKELEAMQTQFAEVAGIKEILEEKLRVIEEEKMTEKERDEARKKREAEKFQTERTALMQQAQDNFNMYSSTKIDNDIMSATAGYEFNNIAQAMQVLKMDGQAGFKKDASGQLLKDQRGQHITVLSFQDENGDTVEMSPKEAIAMYFSRPENAHHLKSNLRPGSGSNPNGTIDANGSHVFRKDRFDDPTVRKDYFAAMKAGKQATLK